MCGVCACSVQCVVCNPRRRSRICVQVCVRGVQVCRHAAERLQLRPPEMARGRVQELLFNGATLQAGIRRGVIASGEIAERM